jgi:hypothetical protein
VCVDLGPWPVALALANCINDGGCPEVEGGSASVTRMCSQGACSISAPDTSRGGGDKVKQMQL